MEVFNLFSDDWDERNDRPGFRHRETMFSEKLGAERIGGSVYELDPGESTWPYHFELNREEWLIVLSGRPTVRTPEGERELEPGDVVLFPAGPDGAHRVTNRGDGPSRMVILANATPDRVAHYPDGKKLWVLAEGWEAFVRSDAGADYWEGE
jgi:uncharacterized cupin superfamily protein